MPRRAREQAVDADQGDDSLVTSACAGDHGSFAVLFRRHAPDLVRFVERRSGSAAVADDVVAVTFEKAWRQVCDIEARGIQFRPWVFRLAGNELIDQQRGARRRRRREASVSAADLRLVEGDASPEDPAGGEALRNALASLSDAHQQVVALRWFADLTPKEVATALGVTTGTAAVRTHRALGALRRALGELHSGIDERPATTTTTTEKEAGA